uniref:Uncharacterized protein n=1 Tax=Setaria italica TaxID=4555 RepID=K4A0L7_SETIT
MGEAVTAGEAGRRCAEHAHHRTSVAPLNPPASAPPPPASLRAIAPSLLGRGGVEARPRRSSLRWRRSAHSTPPPAMPCPARPILVLLGEASACPAHSPSSDPGTHGKPRCRTGFPSPRRIAAARLQPPTKR